MGSRRKTSDSVRLPVISRRNVVGAGLAAAIVSDLNGNGSAAVERREASRPNRRMLDVADRHLSLALHRNACGFYYAAVVSRTRFSERSLYSVAIAIDLSLEAYLPHRGVSDDWNRTHIGHDLRKALAWAEYAGFYLAPSGLADLAAGLTPYYERHAIGWPRPEIYLPPQTPQACETVRGLLRGVSGQIDQETASSGWKARQRREHNDV
jgi:hypothetical protein